ncbi:GSU2403 family nucleotidyltransferase fold protein [Variovorax sp. YR566]|uniref:GSU2403 family nucleotidyltransferase fold protein n=1 Tax=Variovorax sp. YR566 TaxID=3450237 RepID=UPI003F81C76F
MDDLNDFARLAQALVPWGDHLVYVGGWAHRLHRLHPHAHVPDHDALLTRDSDVAIDKWVPKESDIKAALLAHGFREELRGDLRPPDAQYTLGDENAGFYAEFLTPLVGSGYRRGGTQIANEKMAGILAQRIRHLDILLVDPWRVTLDTDNFDSLPAPMEVRVANPLCFMVQKFLIQERRRKQGKAPKDLLYLYDTIQLFGGQLDAFQERWRTVVAPALGQADAKKVIELSQQTFNAVDDDLRNAAIIAQGRDLDPDDMRRACKFAFEHILAI